MSSIEAETGAEEGADFISPKTESIKSSENTQEKGPETLKHVDTNLKKLGWLRKGLRWWGKFAILNTIPNTPENRIFLDEANKPANAHKTLAEIEGLAQKKYDKQYIEESLRQLPKVEKDILEKLEEADEYIDFVLYDSLKKLPGDLEKWKVILRETRHKAIEGLNDEDLNDDEHMALVEQENKISLLIQKVTEKIAELPMPAKLKKQKPSLLERIHNFFTLEDDEENAALNKTIKATGDLAREVKNLPPKEREEFTFSESILSNDKLRTAFSEAVKVVEEYERVKPVANSTQNEAESKDETKKRVAKSKSPTPEFLDFMKKMEELHEDISTLQRPWEESAKVEREELGEKDENVSENDSRIEPDAISAKEGAAPDEKSVAAEEPGEESKEDPWKNFVDDMKADKAKKASEKGSNTDASASNEDDPFKILLEAVRRKPPSREEKGSSATESDVQAAIKDKDEHTASGINIKNLRGGVGNNIDAQKPQGEQLKKAA